MRRARSDVAYALLRAVSKLVSTPRFPAAAFNGARHRHQCRCGTQECVRHVEPRASAIIPTVLLAMAVLLAGCGYHVAGHTDLLPKTIKTIAIPAWTNNTTRYKLTDRIPEAMSREFLTRTRYKVVSETRNARCRPARLGDQLLRGRNYFRSGAVTSYGSSAAGGYADELSPRKRPERCWSNRPNFEVHESYEISIDPGQYFEESDAALDRVSQQVARQVVSAILENF